MRPIVSVIFPNIVGGGTAATLPACCVIISRSFNSAIPYIISLSSKWFPESTHSSQVDSLNLICFCPKLCVRCCTILDDVPITQLDWSYSLCLPCTVSSPSSSLSSPIFSLCYHARSHRMSQIALNISSNVFSGFLVVDPSFS